MQPSFGNPRVTKSDGEGLGSFCSAGLSPMGNDATTGNLSFCRQTFRPVGRPRLVPSSARVPDWRCKGPRSVRVTLSWDLPRQQLADRQPAAGAAGRGHRRHARRLAGAVVTLKRPPARRRRARRAAAGCDSRQRNGERRHRPVARGHRRALGRGASALQGHRFAGCRARPVAAGCARELSTDAEAPADAPAPTSSVVAGPSCMQAQRLRPERGPVPRRVIDRHLLSHARGESTDGGAARRAIP